MEDSNKEKPKDLEREKEKDRGDRYSKDRHSSRRDKEHSRKHSRDDRSPGERRSHHRRSSKSPRSRHRSRSPSDRRHRRRSRTPSPSKSPSPERKKSSNWDMAPPGLQGVNLQALAAINPAIIAPLLAPPVQPTSQTTRQARRLYVGNVPAGTMDFMLKEFLNRTMTEKGFTSGPGDAVLEVQLNLEKGFAFIELRSIDEATNGMQLDGTIFNGVQLRVKRPKDYIPPTGLEALATPAPAGVPALPGLNLGLSRVQPSPIPIKKGSVVVPGAGVPSLPTPVPLALSSKPTISSTVADSPNKIFVGGLPAYLTEDNIKELLATIGPLKSFNLVRDATTGNSKGYAFFEYLDPSLTDSACEGLNGTKLLDKTLIVQRASVGAKKRQEVQSNLLTASLDPATLAKLSVGGPNAVTAAASSVLMLLNMCTLDDLEHVDDEDHIVRDVREECSKHGTVTHVVLHRPALSKEDEEQVATAGTGATRRHVLMGKICKIFVHFESPDQARLASVALAGRKYQSRTLITALFPDNLWESRTFPD